MCAGESFARAVGVGTIAYAIFGEIDFAIVGPTGKILLIKQNAGLLSETPGGLAKKCPGKEKTSRRR